MKTFNSLRKNYAKILVGSLGTSSYFYIGVKYALLEKNNFFLDTLFWPVMIFKN